MNLFNFRYAKSEDAPVLPAFQTRTFWDTYSSSEILEQAHIGTYIAENFNLKKTEADLLDPKTILLLAWMGQRPIAYVRLLGVSSRPKVSAQRPLEISRIYLRKESWGEGIGAALLSRCFAEAIKGFFDVIWLSVWQYNYRGIAFYEKFGFQKVGTHMFDLAGLEQTELVMRKKLRVKKRSYENAANRFW